MLHDVLLMTDNHKKAARKIVENINAMEESKIFIAFRGESSSGKSELGHQVAGLLKVQRTPSKIMYIQIYGTAHCKRWNDNIRLCDLYVL